MLRETAENLKDWSKYLPAVDASKGYKPKTGIAKNYKELLKEGLHEDFIEIGGNYLGEMKNSSEIFEEEKSTFCTYYIWSLSQQYIPCQQSVSHNHPCWIY